MANNIVSKELVKLTRGLFWRHFGVFNVRKVGIYGVDLICHVEREMPSTLTYLVLRPFEAESASKTGTRATGTNTTTPASNAAWIATYWTSGFFSFTDATADFSQEMEGDLIEKKISSADAKSSCEKSQRCHTVKLPSSLCFWRCDDLMLQKASLLLLPTSFFIAHLRKKNLKSIHKHLQEKKSVNKAIFSTCV